MASKSKFCNNHLSFETKPLEYTAHMCLIKHEHILCVLWRFCVLIGGAFAEI